MFCTRRQLFRALNRCRPRWQSTVQHDSSNILHDPQSNPLMQQATLTQNDSSSILHDPQSNPLMQQATLTQNDSSNILHDPQSNSVIQPTLTQNDSSNILHDPESNTHTQNDSSNILPDPQSNPVIQQPTHLNYTMQIMAAINIGNYPSCFQVAAKMKSSGISPDISTYNALMNAVAKDGHALLSWAILDDMLLVGVKPTTTTFAHLIEVIMTPISLSSFSFDRHF
jgi:pentatricopeptide repeat protein